ncbi:hypothetical protein Tco_0365595 [Tanacetum coccineum]
MNPQETQQVDARDEKLVPFTERFKISSTNVRLETTVPQKEDTFQVVIDLIKNSSCFKSFTISADVPKIFMHQFWYTIKKVQGTDSYEFLLANKKCVVNADVFRMILDICPRVEGVDFTNVPDDDVALVFLIKLGYKGPLYKHNNMFVDHIHQPWRNLVAIINKCLSRKTASNDKLRNGQIPPKKSRGKGSQRNKTANDSQETLNISGESESKPEPVKRKTASRRVVKKKVTIYTDDNIISDDPDVALDLGKSISKTEAEDAEAARRRKLGKGTSNPPKKLKGVPSLTLKEQEVADTIQALKESRKTSKRHLGIGGSSEGTGTIPRVLDESTVVYATSKQESEFSEEDQLDDKEKDDKEGDANDEGDDHISDTKDADNEDDETESDEDEIYKYNIRVHKDEDVEMSNAEVEDSDKGDEEVTDAPKADAKKTSEVKDDAKKTELPPTSSSISVSSGFGDQFLKLSSDSSLVSTIKDTTDAKINSLLEVKILFEVPHIQFPSMLRVRVSEISKPSILTPVQESPSIATVTTLHPPSVSTTPPIPQQTTTLIPIPPITIDAPTITTTVSESDALSDVQLRVAKLEKDVYELKKIDPSAKALVALKTQVLSVLNNYLGSKVGDVFQKKLKKHTTDLIQKYSLQQIPELPKKQTPIVDLKQKSEKSPSEILKIKKEQAKKQKMPKFTIKSTNKAALKEFDQKSALYQTMHVNKSFNRNLANYRLYYALMEALIEDENAMDKGVVDTVKDHKRKHDDDEDDDDEDPPVGPNQGFKTGKSAYTKVSVKEPTTEVVMDDASEDVVHDDDQSQDASKPKTTKTLNPEWFTQPLRPPTPNLEWNKRQVVLDQPEQPWFNQMVSAIKDPLTFNNLRANLIDFSKYVLNRLKIDNLTQDILLGPTNNLLKGTWSINIELEYHFQECFNALTSHPGHLTVAAGYFFNNDLEYLKSSDPERMYTTSITKTKATQYKIEWIEDMVPTLWSPTKVGYDKDALKGIKH